METIKIGPTKDILNPPADQPPLPGQMSQDKGKNLPISPEALRGTVSEEDAIKATKGSEFSTLTSLTPQTGPTTGPGQGGPNSVPLGGLVDGALAVELLDALLPALLVVVLHTVKIDMKKTQLQLTAKEKTTLTPLVKACMDSLFINFNTPWAALGVSLVVIYGAKIGEIGLVQVLDKKAERQEAKKNEVKSDKPPVQMQPAQKVNPAPIVNLNKPISIPDNWEPSDEQIWEGMKRRKVSRAEIVVILKKLHSEKKLDEFFKKKPYKK